MIAPLFALALAAQTPQPSVDCSLLTPQQALGLPCAPASPAADTHVVPVAAPPLVAGLPADCDPVPNPYAEPARAARCAAWTMAQQPPPPLPTYEVGARYRGPYPHHLIVVLAITRSVEGVPVVTVQTLENPMQPEQVGEVFAFRADRGLPWTRVQ